MPKVVEKYQLSKKQISSESVLENPAKPKLLGLLDCRSSVISPSTAFDSDLNDFSMWDYLTSDRKNYETRQANLPMPTSSTLDKQLTNSYKRIDEGVPRVKELKMFLDTNNYSNFVVLSEDGTRVESKQSYDRQSGNLVGFSCPLNEHGLPRLIQFDCASKTSVEETFKELPKASTLYTIMVQSMTPNSSPTICALY